MVLIGRPPFIGVVFGYNNYTPRSSVFHFTKGYPLNDKNIFK
jgi:hypothetical protein